jgi:hypothetical protein
MSDDIFGELHEGLTKELLKRVKDGTASAADLNVARQWLNDNNVAADPGRNPGLKKLNEAISEDTLPFDENGTPISKKAH